MKHLVLILAAVLGILVICGDASARGCGGRLRGRILHRHHRGRAQRLQACTACQPAPAPKAIPAAPKAKKKSRAERNLPPALEEREAAEAAAEKIGVPPVSRELTPREKSAKFSVPAER